MKCESPVFCGNKIIDAENPWTFFRLYSAKKNVERPKNYWGKMGGHLFFTPIWSRKLLHGRQIGTWKSHIKSCANELCTYVTEKQWEYRAQADPLGSWGPGDPLPTDIFQNHADFRQLQGKNPILSKFWAQSNPPKNSAAPLTNILDPRLYGTPFWISQA